MIYLEKSVETSSVESGTNFTGDKIVDGTVGRPNDGERPGTSRWASNTGGEGVGPHWVIKALNNSGSVELKFETGNYDDYYIDLTMNKGKEYIIDNLYLKIIY